eukprot:gnl/TRDRNA2_/TRDRNA2_195658_c0_seq1.p1 gnl/TRDRNA2_/TRDRNA2_195658_c0~~gnl/TRDRNA2_/TRDRNA2_195658_c0_seq1.p1  ORF type:complete len:565 (+),score=92.75 gnl/TRDRNA2_/TRDRNA2_195658_c0_seq1:47-1741(+)
MSHRTCQRKYAEYCVGLRDFLRAACLEKEYYAKAAKFAENVGAERVSDLLEVRAELKSALNLKLLHQRRMDRALDELLEHKQAGEAVCGGGGPSLKAVTGAASWSPGAHVVLGALRSSPGLNGLHGVVLRGPTDSGRWEIRLMSGEVKALRPENIFDESCGLLHEKTNSRGAAQHDAGGTAEAQAKLQTHVRAVPAAAMPLAAVPAGAVPVAVASPATGQAAAKPPGQAETPQKCKVLSENMTPGGKSSVRDFLSRLRQQDEHRSGMAAKESCTIHTELLDDPTIRSWVTSAVSGGEQPMDGEQRRNLDEVKAQVRGILDLANHPNTSEQERNAALRNADRVLQKYNLSQEQLYGTSLDRLDGGFSGVIVKSIDGEVEIYDYMHVLADACTLIFEVQYWHQWEEDGSVVFAFYGPCASTFGAAFAWSSAFNRLELLGAGFQWKLSPKSREASRDNHKLNVRLNYKRGIADKLFADATVIRSERLLQSPSLIKYAQSVIRKIELLHLNQLEWEYGDGGVTAGVWHGHAHARGQQDAKHINLQQNALGDRERCLALPARKRRRSAT